VAFTDKIPETVSVDEMVKGPFKRWTHLHIFHSINDQKQTEVLDEINFEIPYGRIGKLFEGYAYTQLQKLFDHRKAATIRTLQGNR
jgi:ligand-binding SRPBCC domain-containing protein